MKTLKTPQFVDTIENRAQRAFNKVKEDVESLEQEQVIQNRNINDLYDLLSKLSDSKSAISNSLSFFEKEIETLHVKDHESLRNVEQLQKDIKELKNSLEKLDNTSIDSLKEYIDSNIKGVTNDISTLQNKLEAQRIEVAQEILNQFNRLRHEFLEKEKFAIKEVKGQVVKEIREDLIEEVRESVKEEIYEELKQQFRDEFSVMFVNTDEYSQKIKTIVSSLNEFKSYIHDYTASQVGIVQQQIEMLKSALNDSQEMESQDKLLTILETMQQKVEEIEDQVNQKADDESFSGIEEKLNELIEFTNSYEPKSSSNEQNIDLAPFESRIESVENKVEEHEEKIEILDTFLEQEVEEKLIPNTEKLTLRIEEVVEDFVDRKSVV